MKWYYIPVSSYTKGLQGVKKTDITAADNVLADMRNNFSLIPCLIGHGEFVDNASRMLCRLLLLPVLHAWVLDPEVSSYETLQSFSHSQLEDYCKGLEEDHPDHAVCHDLLNANQLDIIWTSYFVVRITERLLCTILLEKQIGHYLQARGRCFHTYYR